MGYRGRVAVGLLMLALVCGPALAEDDDGASTVGEEMLIEAEAVVGDAGEANLVFDADIDHYENDGYPEDADGRLVLERHDEGPMIYVEGERLPYLLYAQYENKQRDAVFLSRTGTFTDTLPSGEAYEVPYGFGAVKFSTAYVSVVESLITPHFSDNQKTYVQFPLNDLYLGASFSLTGITAIARYVGQEQLVAYLQAGFNPFGSIDPASVLNQYYVPIHVGGGYRFPGIFPELLGENLMTIGGELMLGVGDRDGDLATGLTLLTGPYLDIERVLYDEEGRRRDFRTDPRPYNYRVSSLSIRIGAHFNIAALGGSGSFVLPSVALSYQYNIIGPPIPAHEFKETSILYVNEIYRDDLLEQKERREAREARE